MSLDGFSGATPAEICQRYAAGFIDRAHLVDELTRFPYVKGGQTDGYDSLIVDPPGTWSEVSAAVRRGQLRKTSTRKCSTVGTTVLNTPEQASVATP